MVNIAWRDKTRESSADLLSRSRSYQRCCSRSYQRCSVASNVYQRFFVTSGRVQMIECHKQHCQKSTRTINLEKMCGNATCSRTRHSIIGTLSDVTAQTSVQIGRDNNTAGTILDAKVRSAPGFPARGRRINPKPQTLNASQEPQNLPNGTKQSHPPASMKWFASWFQGCIRRFASRFRG